MDRIGKSICMFVSAILSACFGSCMHASGRLLETAGICTPIVHSTFATEHLALAMDFV